jgi:hypothetical protein
LFLNDGIPSVCCFTAKRRGDAYGRIAGVGELDILSNQMNTGSTGIGVLSVWKRKHGRDLSFEGCGEMGVFLV